MNLTNFSNIKVASIVGKTEHVSGVCTVMRSEEERKTNHYHTLVDAIPRLYLLNQPEYKKIDKIKLLLSSEPTTIERFFIKKLAPQNLKITVVENPEIFYLAEQLIFPSFLSSSDGGCLPSVYLEYFRDKVLPKRESKKANRIFISRANARWRYMINEAELFEALKPYGFKKYFLEDMSIEDEIELFYDADYVVGTFGAGLTNMIFSHKIKVLELFASEFSGLYYYYLAKSLGHTYGYCYGYNSLRSRVPTFKVPIIKEFRVNVSEVVERLLELEKQHEQTTC
ncbi:glycosyltransferase family 61 protein [Coleofasciculus sp.]|uniref:glycosyltransferase family 61 protein n=1 Tax=Coleofasciculus sp. TaxID=3100458 RepID=UPI0039F91CF8